MIDQIAVNGTNKYGFIIWINTNNIQSTLYETHRMLRDKYTNVNIVVPSLCGLHVIINFENWISTK